MKEPATAIGYPQSNSLTQGTIFSCAMAEDYRGCKTHGLVVTAKCDVANDKARTYNYLPVVTLDDWLHRDGRIIMGERLMADTLGAMTGVLKDSGFSSSILETESPRSIVDALYPAGEIGSKASKARERFEEMCRRHDLATAAFSTARSETICLEIAKAVPKLKDSLLRELVHQKLTGYYFLSRIEPDGDDIGYVILIREIQIMPRTVARAVGKGMDFRQYDEMCNDESSLRGRLSIERQDLAMPVGMVRSPNLEHLMQSFSLLFGRIGLDDPSSSYVDSLWMRQPSVSEMR